MVTRNFAKYCAAALLAVACTVQDPTQEQAPTTSEPVLAKASTIVTIEFGDELLSSVEEAVAQGLVTTKSDALNRVLDNLGVTDFEPLFPCDPEWEAAHHREGLDRFYLARCSQEVPRTKAVSALKSIQGIVSVSGSHRIRPRAIFNDPYLGYQWHLVNTSYPSADIHLEDVWDRYTTGDPSVIVAVIDEGVDISHPDLKDNLWSDSNNHHGYNAILQNYTINYSGDYASGHGSHVAGVIAAVNNNGIGVSGIAGGNKAEGKAGVKLLPVSLIPVNDTEYDAYENVGQGIDKYGNDLVAPRAFVKSCELGALISQNSWGLYADGILDSKDEDGIVSAEEMAYFKSISLDDDPALKAAIDYFIKYAGCDPDGNQRADSPMKGGLVFFAAGNEGHLGVDYDPYAVYEPVIAVGATNKRGGAAYYSQFGNWIDIAAPGGDDSGYIWSTLPKAISSSRYGGSGWVGTSMACPHASGVAALIVSYFGGPGFTADNAKDILMSGLGGTIGGNKPIGKKLDALGSFEYGVKHYPAGGGQEERNVAPTVSLSTSTLTLKAHESAVIDITAYDVNGDEITLSCQEGSSALSFDPQAQTLSIEGWSAPAGTYTATVTASDGELSSSATLSYTLLPNHAPTVQKNVENILLKGLQRVGTIQPVNIFTDPDGETLTIESALSGDPCVTLDGDQERMNVLPAGFGRATVTLTARDFLGEEASTSFLVVVIDPSNPVTISPEVVTDIATVTIETPDRVPVDITLYNALGGKVLALSTSASAFYPVELDLSSLSPGRYTAEVTYNNKSRKVRLLKY